MDGRSVVAWNLRRIRSSRGLTIEELAVDAGVNDSYVGRIERKSANASVDVLDKLCRVLKVRLVELFVEPAPGAPKPEPLQAGRRRR